jgi:hypothetical protein
LKTRDVSQITEEFMQAERAKTQEYPRPHRRGSFVCLGHGVQTGVVVRRMDATKATAARRFVIHSMLIRALAEQIVRERLRKGDLEPMRRDHGRVLLPTSSSHPSR